MIGRRTWAIPEGFIPTYGSGPEPELTNHETVCVLNANDEDAHIEITIYYPDKEPVGPYRLTIPACRVRHVRFNDLIDPEAIPLGVDYGSVVESDVPVVVQHTRLDSRQAANALLSTIAFGLDD